MFQVHSRNDDGHFTRSLETKYVCFLSSATQTHRHRHTHTYKLSTTDRHKDTHTHRERERLMPMTHAPETRTRKPVPVFCRCVNESVSIFSCTKIWYRVEQCSTRGRKPWPKWWVLIGQTIASCVVCLYKLCCLLFYCFKVNWEYSSIEKLIQKFCFQFHLVRKTLSENGTSFLVQVFGTGFWCVCHWHKSTPINKVTVNATVCFCALIPLFEVVSFAKILFIQYAHNTYNTNWHNVSSVGMLVGDHSASWEYVT